MANVFALHQQAEAACGLESSISSLPRFVWWKRGLGNTEQLLALVKLDGALLAVCIELCLLDCQVVVAYHI